MGRMRESIVFVSRSLSYMGRDMGKLIEEAHPVVQVTLSATIASGAALLLFNAIFPQSLLVTTSLIYDLRSFSKATVMVKSRNAVTHSERLSYCNKSSRLLSATSGINFVLFT